MCKDYGKNFFQIQCTCALHEIIILAWIPATLASNSQSQWIRFIAEDSAQQTNSYFLRKFLYDKFNLRSTLSSLINTSRGHTIGKRNNKLLSIPYCITTNHCIRNMIPKFSVSVLFLFFFFSLLLPLLPCRFTTVTRIKAALSV